MLGSCTAIAFLATADGDTARRFYGDTLGLTLREDTPFALVFELSGGELRIQKVERVVAPPYTALGWSVDDIDAAVDGLAERAVVFEQFGMPDQDDRGIWSAPGGARVAWFRDPDGQLLSVTQHP